MTDRELLRLAAKAAGIPVSWEPVHNCYWISLGHGLEHKPWNPLADDGDALRLAVTLGVDIVIGGGLTTTYCDGHRSNEYHGDDPAAATRRAIVQAAAAIGEAAGEV